jgi:hypothetical protein
MYHNTDKQIQNASSASSKLVKAIQSTVKYSTIPREARAARSVFALLMLKWEPDGSVGDDSSEN